MKYEVKKVELVPIVIDADEFADKLSQITEIMYEYFCQLQQNSSSTEINDAAEPLTTREIA